MKVLELFSSIRTTLQDHDKNYWDDSELLSYYNECVKVMASERLENKTTATLALNPAKNDYDTSGILRYIRCVDANGKTRELYPDDLSGKDDNLGIIVKDYNKIYVNDPTVGTTLTLTIIALPSDSNTTSIVRSGDETALKYYILSKSYEKDNDMENFQKSQYFYAKYLEAFKLLKDSSSINYSTSSANVTKAYYY